MLPPAHPMLLGPAILQHLKRGKTVEKITIMFTHGQLHQIFSHDLTKHYPLEMTLAEGQDMEKKIDCRLFEVPWVIDLRPKKKPNVYDITVDAPDRIQQEPPTPEEQAWHNELFSASHDLAATEFQLLQRQQRIAALRKTIRQQPDQPQPEGTAGG